jgi:photosystem II stability/assembly factor-like uncharacterized protein
MIRRQFAMAAALTALSAAPLTAGNGRWTAIGPEGGTVLTFAAHPDLPGTFYAGTASAGVFATRDGGATWAPVNRGIAGAQVFDLEIDPRQPASLYAATSAGVFATHDGGGQWTFLRPHVNELAIAAAGPPALYAAREAVIWRSTDGGATWERRGELGLAFVHDLRVHPDDSSRLYAATGGGVARSNDGGATWELNDGLGTISPAAREVAFAPGDPETLYAVLVHDGIWKSDDGGASWSPRLQLNAPGAVDFRTVAVDPEVPEIVYAGLALFPPSIGGTAIGEVWRSLDAGTSWQRVNGGGAYVHDLAVAAGGGRVLAGVAGIGVLAGRRGRGLVPAHAGLRAAPVSVVAADPHRPGRLLAVAAVGGGSAESNPRLLRFAPAGGVWTEVPTGLTDHQPIQALAFDPERPGRVHAGAAAALLLSRDDGRTWQRTAAPGTIVDLAVAPADSAVVYAAGTRQRLCGIPFCGTVPEPLFARSRDGGATWTSLDARVAGAVGRSASLEAVAADSGASVHVGGFAVASSSNGGATWVRRNAPPGGFADLAVEAGAPPVLYGAARFRNGAAVWVSRDRGLSWSPAAQGLPPGVLARRLTVDPESPGRVFAGTTDGVFVSTDGGRRWQRLGFALAGRAVTALDYDAATRTLYAGISSGPGLFAHTFP